MESECEVIRQRSGPWTAHNIRLGDECFTMGRGITPDEYKLRRIAQIVQDHCGENLSGLRVLDLACLEGMYGIECALRGAEVIAIEGRRQHVEKAEFAARALNLPAFRVIQGDVRGLSRKEHGEFDVILCLGILYHIDHASLFPLIAAMHECCRRILIIDTHVAMRPKTSISYGGQTFKGIDFVEFQPNLPDAQKKKKLWASLDNNLSFWPTAPSLFNALSQAGFTSAYECHNPAEASKWRDRKTIVAVRGKRVELRCNPQVNGQPLQYLPERAVKQIHPCQYMHRAFLQKLINIVPAGLKWSVANWFGRRR